MRFRAITTVLIGVGLIAAFVLQLDSSAQENATATAVPQTPTPTPSPTAYPLQGLRFGLLAQTEVVATTNGPATVSAATLTLQPGQASLPFVNTGDTVFVVTSGVIVVESDDATLQVVDSAALIGLEVVGGTPGPVSGQEIGTGWQVTLPTGSTTTIRNESAAAATVMVLSLVPDAASEIATPAA